jgi:hypothetical protein
MEKVIILTICFIFATIASVLAEVELERHAWVLGTEISHIKYEEPDVMEEKGMIYGVASSYSYHNRLMLRAEGKGSWGQVDYKNSGTLDDVDDYMLEFRGLAGYDFPILKATVITPYIGFGYRYLNDDLKGTTSTGALGYERESNYYYSPIGIETITELDDVWSMGVTVEFDYFWKGIQKSHLSDADPLFNDLENDQDDGYGVRGSIKLLKKGEMINLIIEPYVRYWNIKKSEEEPVTFAGVIFGSGCEPKNNSTEIGGKIAVQF